MANHVFDQIDNFFGFIEGNLRQPVDFTTQLQIATANSATMALFSYPADSPELFEMFNFGRTWFDWPAISFIFLPYLLSTFGFIKDPMARFVHDC